MGLFSRFCLLFKRKPKNKKEKSSSPAYISFDAVPLPKASLSYLDIEDDSTYMNPFSRMRTRPIRRASNEPAFKELPVDVPSAVMAPNHDFAENDYEEIDAFCNLYQPSSAGRSSTSPRQRHSFHTFKPLDTSTPAVNQGKNNNNNRLPMKRWTACGSYHLASQQLSFRCNQHYENVQPSSRRRTLDEHRTGCMPPLFNLITPMKHPRVEMLKKADSSSSELGKLNVRFPNRCHSLLLREARPRPILRNTFSMSEVGETLSVKFWQETNNINIFGSANQEYMNSSEEVRKPTEVELLKASSKLNVTRLSDVQINHSYYEEYDVDIDLSCQTALPVRKSLYMDSFDENSSLNRTYDLKSGNDADDEYEASRREGLETILGMDSDLSTLSAAFGNETSTNLGEHDMSSTSASFIAQNSGSDDDDVSLSSVEGSYYIPAF